MSMGVVTISMLRKQIDERNVAAEAKRASYVSHQEEPNPAGSTARLHKSKLEGTAPPNELTENDKSNIAIDSLRYHGRRRLMIKRGGQQPFVLDDFSHDELSKADSIRKLNLPPDAPLPSRNQDRRFIFGKSHPQAKAAGKPADGSLPSVAGLELGATADAQQREPLSDETERERPRSIPRSGTVLRPLEHHRSSCTNRHDAIL